MADNTLFEDLVLINDLRTVLCAHNETIESEEVKSTRGLWIQPWLAAPEMGGSTVYEDIEKYGPKKYFKIVVYFLGLQKFDSSSFLCPVRSSSSSSSLLLALTNEMIGGDAQPIRCDCV